MRLSRRNLAVLIVSLGLICAVPQLLARKKDKDKTANSGLSEEKRAVHALNRLTFGPRPGDVQQIIATGIDPWIDLQLHPDRIDDSALNARLEPLLTLRMNSKQIAENFPDPQEINQVMNGKKAMPSDPARRAVYEVQLARQQAKKERKEEPGKNTAAIDRVANAKMVAGGADGSMTADNASTVDGAAKSMPEDPEQARLREEQLYADLEVQQLPNLPPDQRFQKVLKMQPAAQLSLANSLKGGKGQEFLEGLSPRQKEVLIAMNNPGAAVTNELTQAKLLRAIYSERQLEEVMTDFWFNHFNVFVDKGLDRLMLTSYERDVIRPHVLRQIRRPAGRDGKESRDVVLSR